MILCVCLWLFVAGTCVWVRGRERSVLENASRSRTFSSWKIHLMLTTIQAEPWETWWATGDWGNYVFLSAENVIPHVCESPIMRRYNVSIHDMVDDRRDACFFKPKWNTHIVSPKDRTWMAGKTRSCSRLCMSVLIGTKVKHAMLLAPKVGFHREPDLWSCFMVDDHKWGVDDIFSVSEFCYQTLKLSPSIRFSRWQKEDAWHKYRRLWYTPYLRLTVASAWGLIGVVVER